MPHSTKGTHWLPRSRLNSGKVREAQEAMEVRRVVGDGREVEQSGVRVPPGGPVNGVGNGVAQRPFLRTAPGPGTRGGPDHRIPVVGAEPPAPGPSPPESKRGAPRNHGKRPPAVDRDDPIGGGHKAGGRELGPDRAEDLYVLPRGRFEPPRKREESALPEAGERRPDPLAREEERLAGRVDPERGKGRRGDVRRLDDVEGPFVPGEEVAHPFLPDLDGKRPRPSPREPGEVVADQPHEFPRGLHDRHGRCTVRRGRQHPFRPLEAELEDPRMLDEAGTGERKGNTRDTRGASFRRPSGRFRAARRPRTASPAAGSPPRNGRSAPARCGPPGRRPPGNPPTFRSGTRSPAPPAASGRRPGPCRGRA